MNSKEASSGAQYVVYDRASGEIIQTYSRLSVETNDYISVPEDELKNDLVKDNFLVS